MIIPEQHIVASGYDPLTGLCAYVLEQNGKRFTVRIPRAELEKHGGNPGARRMHLIKACAERLKGEPDPDQVVRSSDGAARSPTAP